MLARRRTGFALRPRSNRSRALAIPAAISVLEPRIVPSTIVAHDDTATAVVGQPTIIDVLANDELNGGIPNITFPDQTILGSLRLVNGQIEYTFSGSGTQTEFDVVKDRIGNLINNWETRSLANLQATVTAAQAAIGRLRSFVDTHAGSNELMGSFLGGGLGIGGTLVEKATYSMGFAVAGAVVSVASTWYQDNIGATNEQCLNAMEQQLVQEQTRMQNIIIAEANAARNAYAAHRLQCGDAQSMGQEAFDYTAWDPESSDDGEVVIDLSAYKDWYSLTAAYEQYEQQIQPEMETYYGGETNITIIYAELLRFMSDRLDGEVTFFQGYEWRDTGGPVGEGGGSSYIYGWFQYWSSTNFDWPGLDGTEIADELNNLRYLYTDEP